MNHKLHQLNHQKALLQAKAANQRTHLSLQVAQWQVRLTWVDRALAAVRFVKHNPGMVLGAGALFTMFTPFKAARILLGSWAAMKGVRDFRGLFSKD